ncbi:MAG: hypothetical protein M1826_004683 [Phylliscum demangeonii]|nr:MAG: hypothetical protein M1826_004683 [Phylliscum demangeonii]
MRPAISLLTGWAIVTTVLAGPVSKDNSQPASRTTTTSSFGWDPSSLWNRRLRIVPPLPKHGWDVVSRVRLQRPGADAAFVLYAMNLRRISNWLVRQMYQHSYSTFISYTHGRDVVLVQAARRMKKYRLKREEKRRYRDCATWLALQPDALELIELLESICLRSAKDERFTMDEMTDYYMARERPSPDPSAGPLDRGHDGPPSPDDDPDPNRHQFTNGVTHLVHGMGSTFQKATVAVEKAAPFVYRTAGKKGATKAVDAVIFAGE